MSKINPWFFPSFLFGPTVINVDLQKIPTKERREKEDHSTQVPPRKKDEKRINYRRYNMQSKSTALCRWCKAVGEQNSVLGCHPWRVRFKQCVDTCV
jgi:hypothetical protein